MNGYFKYIRKGIPNYWYGNNKQGKKIALTAIGISWVISGLFFLFINDNGILMLLLTVFLQETLMVVGLVIYLLVRDNIPNMLGMVHTIDNYFLHYGLLFILVVLLNRIFVNLIAERVYGMELS